MTAAMGCYRSILVAYDGSADATVALQHAAALARDQHARIVLLTVVPRVTVPPVNATAALAARDLERSFSRVLHDAIEALPPDVGLDTRLVHGKPARQILDVAREHDCDLIVMGSHGHGRLHDALIGCTSATVMRESTIPVLLVRAHHVARDEDAAVPSPPETQESSPP